MLIILVPVLMLILITIIITRNTFCRTRSLSNATFSFLITWRSSSSKSAAVYKISSKSDDFSLRYGDKNYNDFQKGGRPPSWNRFTTIPDHPRCLCCWPQLPVKFLCQSDTQIWRHSYLNFSHIWLEIPIQAPKMGISSDLGPLDVIIHHRDPQKAHPCVNPRLLSYQQ